MEIRLRKKGMVETVDGFSRNCIPQEIRPTDGSEGIDLTAYSVVYANFGRGGHEAALELQKKVVPAVVVYTYRWRNGSGEGVLLPDLFNTSRVRFYKSAAQLAREGELAQKISVDNLRREIEEQILGVRVYLRYDLGGVMIVPDQETTAREWSLYVKTFAEAMGRVDEMRPRWREWNDRALAIYAQRGLQNPGNGMIELLFRLATQDKPERVGICFRPKLNVKRWIILENKDDQWIESREVAESFLGGPISF